VTYTTTFGSVCSGIEAASVAWHLLGWRAAWLAEIEAAPALALAHHYPDVPNLGDMNLIPGLLRNGDILAPDVLCGGTPCQAFSVAGLRNSLDDARGNLSLKFCDIANEIDIQRSATGLLPATVVWENVPGVLSTKDNAFGCFLGQLAGEDCALVPPGGKWSNAGAVFGPKRAIAWRVFDAQYFGLAQRRRRVFVVASARNGFDPAAVLFEFEGVRRDSAPCRGQGQEAAAGTLRSTDGGSDVDHARAGHIVPITGTLTATYGEQSGRDLAEMPGGLQLAQAFGGNNTAGPIQVATACRAHASPHLDFESETFLVQQGPITFDSRQNCVSSVEVFGALGSSSPQAQAVAFSCKDYGGDASVELAPTMRAMGHSGSHANAGGQLAVCITGDITHTLKAEGFDASEDGTGRGQPIVAVDTLYNKGFNSGDHNASTQEAYAGTLLRILQKEIGEEAFAEWRLGILDSLQPAQVLRADVHGAGIRCEADEARCGLDDRALPRQEGSSARGMPEMREAGRQRCAPQGRGLSEQLTRELDSALSKLPHEGTQPAWLLQGMRGSGEGAGVLQSPLPAVQGGPFAVRRLTPVECERLMGFPDGYTAIPLPERRKGAAGVRVMADGPRYKALGNSWAVPNVRWIGRRIDQHLRDLGGKA
jgi:DNA (cytosine-5)-methyltransferase 1